MATENMISFCREYLELGWKLIQIPRGCKGPKDRGWNLEANCIASPEAAAHRLDGGNIGLAHAYSGTCALDIDDYETAKAKLAAEDIDLDALLSADDAVQIRSGRENRAKLLYRRPKGTKPLRQVQLYGGALDLRCATRDGLTVQDVLPPSIHPDTKAPYQWGGLGDWHHLPELPEAVLRLWQAKLSLPSDEPKAKALGNGPDRDLGALSISDFTRRLILEGDTASRYRSRSEALYGAIKDLLQAGCDDNTITTILTDPHHKLSAKALEAGHGDIEAAKRWLQPQIHKAPSEGGVGAVGVRPGQAGSPRAHTHRPGFPLVPVAKLLEAPSPLNWLIEGYLLQDTLALLFGDPAVGKSLLALDWAASVATGRPWCGRRVSQGSVIYIAGEGHAGITRRLKAWALDRGFESELTSASMLISERGAALLDNGNLDDVIAAIDNERQNQPIRLIVIDTLHRNMGGGDENSAKDIGAFIKALDALRTRYGAAVLVVHHSGHANTDRARGSSALRAAVDTEYQLTSTDNERVLTGTKMKDSMEPETVGFTLKTVQLPWRSEEGECETSVVLDPTGKIPAPRKARAPESVRTAFKSLIKAINAHGTTPPWAPEPGETLPRRVVECEHWRAASYADQGEKNQDTKRKAFDRALKQLTANKAVGAHGDYYWPTPELGPWPALEDLRRSNERRPFEELVCRPLDEMGGIAA